MSAGQVEIPKNSPALIAVVTHDLLGDPFWDPFRAGLAEARQASGCQVRHLRPETYSLAGLLQLTEEALALRPDGLLITLPDPEAQHSLLEEAIAAGLPVAVLNTFDRRPAGQRLRTIFRIGADDHAGGRIAAERMLEARSCRSVLALDHYRLRNTCHAARIAGFQERMEEARCDVSTHAVDTLDPAAPAIVVAALASTEFDAVLSIGPPGFALLSDALALSDRPRPLHVTFDSTPRAIAALGSGELLGVVESQPHLQAYFGVMAMAQYLRHGQAPIGDVLTGPNFIPSTGLWDIVP